MMNSRRVNTRPYFIKKVELLLEEEFLFEIEVHLSRYVVSEMKYCA